MLPHSCPYRRWIFSLKTHEICNIYTRLVYMVYHLKIQTYFQIRGPLCMMVLSTPKSMLNLLKMCLECNNIFCLRDYSLKLHTFQQLSSFVTIWFRRRQSLRIECCIFTLKKGLPYLTIFVDHVIILWKYIPIYRYSTCTPWHLKNFRFILVSSFSIPGSVGLILRCSHWNCVWCSLIISASFKRIFCK